jgi:nucleotidyltransferase/DNA polymerase involved in DNA repair
VLFAEVPCFYATVEIAQDPALAGRPVLVGGDPRKRGLVQSASPEALAAGVEPEMPVMEALRLCPTARAVRTNVRLYRETSRRLLACLRREAERVEPFGLGAAYLEGPAAGDPLELAARLRERVRAELQLPLRVGIATGKFLARLAAEEAGEACVRSIPPGAEQAFLSPLPVTRLEGVGRKTAAALAEIGARTIGDVASLGRERLEEAFGTHGLRIFALACARDDAPLRASRHPQSLTREVTVRGGADDRAILAEHVSDLVRDLAEELRRQALATRLVALRLRHADQGTTTRSQTLGAATAVASELQAVAGRLLDRARAGSRPVRTIGIQLSRLAPAGEADRQLDLFPRS